MKSSSLGPLIALSALAVAPSAALAADATTPSAATTPEPAPSMTSPVTGSTPVDSAPQTTASADAGTTAPGTTPSGSTPTTDTPQATDPTLDQITDGVKDKASARRKKRAQARESQAERDPQPAGQASSPTLIPPSALSVQAVPNFFIEDFDIPPFLLPIYQAAGSEYGIRWEVLAGINRVETNFGRNLNVSSAGALGWMQFMPATWEQYGVDANDDGEKDPFNPADAIFAAARYLKAAGGDTDLRQGIYAYNHADWYVDQVMQSARAVAAYPDALISSLTGLTQGIFPVASDDDAVDYPGKLKADKKAEKVKVDTNAADPVDSTEGQNSIEITATAGSSVVAVQDGTVEKIGHTERLGDFVRLRDSYGNRYTYANLGEVQDEVPVPKPTKDEENASTHSEGEADADATATTPDSAPTSPATAGTLLPSLGTTPSTTPDASASQATDPLAPATPATTPETTPSTTASTTTAAPDDTTGRSRLSAKEKAAAKTTGDTTDSATPAAETPRRIRFRARDAVTNPNTEPEPASVTAKRLYAHPTRPASYAAGGAAQINGTEVTPTVPTGPTGEMAKYFSIDYGLKAKDVELKKLKAGQAVIAGTILGKTKLSLDGKETSKVTFEIRPAGKKAPRIDPRPILDGWRLSDKTDFYGAQAKKAIESGDAATDATVGQVLLMGKEELQDRVLADKRITIYECGRRDIKGGLIDRRILALLEVMAVKGMTPNVTALECGHSLMTASGNVSEHSTGTAVDIGSVYGTVISPQTQGVGSITDKAVREILKLQGNMKPHQIITLMKYEGEDNTLALSDHDDHIHVGYKPTTGVNGKQLEQLLKPGQWDDLVKQLSSIEVPNVAATPSDYSVSVEKTTP